MKFIRFRENPLVRESFKVSAPGKLMLLGEHAVLRGRACLVCAIDQRIYLRITPRADSKIVIHSDLGRHITSLDHFEVDQQFSFLTHALQPKIISLSRGFEISVQSDFVPTVGLGSSAAITAAMTYALCLMINGQANLDTVFKDGLHTIRSVQGEGSGADLAASIFGGVLLYRAAPLERKCLKQIFPITTVYSGMKTPTVSVIRTVQAMAKRLPELYEQIYDMMNFSALTAAEAIEQNDLKQLGCIFNVNQGLLDAIGVSNTILAEINFRLREDSGIYGSKISGSGLGDCVVAVGNAMKKLPYQRLDLKISPQGVRIE